MSKSRVTVLQGITLNLGNFNSARVDVGVETDALDGENVKDAMDRAYGFVEDYLDDKIQEMKKEIVAE